MNVTLIGMPGAGKSFIGKHVAEQFDLEQHDSDIELSKSFGGKDIQTILDELGEEKYLQTEAALAIEQTTGKDGLLISPAGSVIYVQPWIDHLKNISKVVYLKVPFPVVEERLKNVPPRAIIGLGKKSLKQLYDERTPLYEKYADLVIETEKCTFEECVDKIVEFLTKK